jgi:hypothetical protein
MEICVLRAPGTRKSRPRIRIVGRCLHVRLGALRCAPARGVTFGIAQLHAAASPVRFRTVAVASACWNTSQNCGCVRE